MWIWAKSIYLETLQGGTNQKSEFVEITDYSLLSKWPGIQIEWSAQALRPNGRVPISKSSQTWFEWRENTTISGFSELTENIKPSLQS